MAESTPQKIRAAASLFSPDVEWQGKLVSAVKDGIIVKTAPSWGLEKEGNNQEEDAPDEMDDGDSQENSTRSSPKHETPDKSVELQHLRNENSALVQRLARVETEHVQSVDKLEAKLQQAIETHREIEQRLRSQLQTVLDEQQAAVENARKVRSVLTRVSSWMRQVQRAAQSECSALHGAKPPLQGFELQVTPRTDTPYTLWTGGASLATKCESPTASYTFTLNQDPVQWPVPDSYEVLVDSTVNSLPPPAPGRHRTKDLSYKGFSYVGYSVPSPSSGPTEVVPNLFGGTEFVLNGLPSVDTASHKDTPVPKRGAGSLLAYCAQVVTTSLASVRSSPSPQERNTPAWKLDRLAPVLEVLEVDEETGQCSARPTIRSQPLNVAVPNLSIGLL
ncbi:hypothetical protein PHYPSEUDO_006104 [Phytophthora pseudosyringae]|uniref:Uncharacterized protein n=1 Tax=Phytophthora pseudosyringae TaxID=221518 RepID=A0A8T1WH46_9STRA|nr:hypothetical protein PHYPSEUDO_006104 [Phytophthora pseudosyringae]